MKIRSSSILAAAVAVMFAFALAGPAAAVTTAQVSVNGGTPIAIPLEDALYNVYCARNSCTNGPITGPGFSVEIDATFYPNPDSGNPGIAYGFDITNSTGSALSISILLSQTITPVLTPGIVNTSMSGSTTDGATSPGNVSINPLAPPAGVPPDNDGNTEIQVFTLSDDGGTTLSNADIDLGQPFFSTLPSESSPPENSPILAGPIGSGSSYDFMRLDLNFSVAGGGAFGSGDIYTANGSAVLTPEPETAALLALGLFGIGYAGRRRGSA